MNTLKIADLGSLNIYQFILSPKAELADTVSEGIEADVENVPRKNMVDLQLKCEDGNPAIIIHGSIQS